MLKFLDKDGAIDFVVRAWTPQEALDERTPAERDLFKLWIKQGEMIAVPGRVIDYAYVAREIAKLSTKFKIKVIRYDRWHIDLFKQAMDAIGCKVPLEPFGQGFKSMSPAIAHFCEKALQGKIRHGGHPVLTAALAEAVVVHDDAGNLKLSKGRSIHAASIRIDPLVAAVMAMGSPQAEPPPRTFTMMFI